MKGPLLDSTNHYGRDASKSNSQKIPNSIINSVTNDEDDLLDSKKNSGHSIVRSVTNDEDEWIDSGRQVPLRAAYDLRNHPSAFLENEAAINGFEQTESSILPKHSLPFEENLFDKESFLIRYEHMMMEQEREQLSTISHLQFFFDLLIELQREEQQDDDRRQPLNENEENCLLMEFSIKDLKEAQKKLKDSEKYHIVKTDEQFLMVLDILCKDKYNPSDTYCPEEKDRKISWVEIIQCYRNCVAGMQTLEKIGSHGTIRNRAKERTIALLSGYGNSSFVDDTPSMVTSSGTKLVDSNKKTHDHMSVIKTFSVDQGTHRKTKIRGLINHPFFSFVAGAIFAGILLFDSLSNSQPMTEPSNALFERQTQDVKGPIDANESLYSTAIDLEMLDSLEKSVDESMNPSRDPVHTGQTEGDSSLFMTKSFIETKGTTVPSSVKARASNSAPPPQSNSSKTMVYVTGNEQDETISRKPSSLETKVANVLGGTATIIYFLSTSTVSATTFTGLGVTIAALAGRGVRDWITNIWITKIWKTVNPNGRKRNEVSR